MEKIGIIGAGGWGTALSILFSEKFQVTLWENFPDYAKILREKRENPEFLPDFKIPESVMITDEISYVCTNDILIITVPSQYFRSILKRMKPFYNKDKHLFLIGTKGLETETGMRMSEILINEFGQCRFAVISGPTIASEVAAGKPTAAVVASDDKILAQKFQHMFSSKTMRLYTSIDVCGVEICGGYKNILAIGAGIIDVLELGNNAKASYLTRSIKEMKNFGTLFGAKEETFWGLAGIGDLITTSFSPASRNHRFGQAVAMGKKQEFLASTKMVVEGIYASKAIMNISRKYNIELPIASAVYRIIHQNSRVYDEIINLMTRRLKDE